MGIASRPRELTDHNSPDFRTPATEATIEKVASALRAKRGLFPMRTRSCASA